MKPENIKRQALLTAVAMMLLTGCMKDFLDVKRDKSQVIPVTLEDYQAIFDNASMLIRPNLGEIGSDDYYLLPQHWGVLTNPVHKNAHVWADEIYQGQTNDDWNRSYEHILFSNFVLDGLAGIAETPANKAMRDEVAGAARYYRGTNFFLLAQLFCAQYDASTADAALGLPLRTTSNINAQYPRASLAATYAQIIDDLEAAAQQLPAEVLFHTRPSRGAALAMLANVSLQTGDYRASLAYADATLQLSPEILDYNEIDASLSAPFPRYGNGNKEIILFSHALTPTPLAASRINVDSLLLESYQEKDLRRQAFFYVNGGRDVYKGSYSGMASSIFTGITTPEMLLVRAECHARLGNVPEATADLNRLLSKRFMPEDFEPVGSGISPEDALTRVLSERRKELVFRGRRWHDLKRFDREPGRAKPLMRVMEGTEYVLPAGSPKWVWPLPPDVVNLGGLTQNPR